MADETVAGAGERGLSSRELLGLGRESYQLARQVSLSTQSPEDGAQLLRKAIYQLMLAVVPSRDRKEVNSFAACRARIEGVAEHEAIFAGLLEDVGFIDEVIGSFALVRNERPWGDRFEGVLKKMPEVIKAVRRQVATQPDQGRAGFPVRKLATVGAILGGVAAAFVVIYFLAGIIGGDGEPQVDRSDTADADPPALPPAEPGEPFVFDIEWIPETAEVRADESRCFTGQYFSGKNFETLVETRRDCRVFFDWGKGAPYEALPVDSFSVRWTGTLRVPETAEYRLILGSDDGGRMFLDDKEIVTMWHDHGYIQAPSNPLQLEEGVDYALRIEFFDSGDVAQVALLWSSPSIKRQPLSGKHVTPATP